MNENEEIKLKRIISAYSIHTGGEIIIKDDHGTMTTDYDNMCKAISGMYKKLSTGEKNGVIY